MSDMFFEHSLENLFQDKKNIFLVDNNLSENCPKDRSIKISISEEIKSLESYQAIIKELLKFDITRSSHLIVIGGGSLSDLGGFIAATIFRGISWSVVPTTLLSQIDAAIGGKTGLDINNTKNLIGSFHKPESIYINNFWLETLPKDELLSGKGELVKYAFLNQDIYTSIMTKQSLAELVKQCALYKEIVTKNDFKEQGDRIKLNLGHTIGHGIESVTAYPHGICVIMGIHLILKMYQVELLKSFSELLEVLNIDMSPYIYPSSKEIEQFIKLDKKRIPDNKIKIIIPSKIGEIDIVEEKIEDFFKKLKKSC